MDVEAIDRMTSEMKERISEIRTLPVDYLYQRFRRSMRNLSKDNNKQVDLVLEGGDTRLGRTIIDGLFDPLLHVLRNAVAHGLEAPEERKALGKPTTGIIKIVTRRSGSTATITISDDGRGIQVERVRSKAIRLGWITEEDKLDRKDLIDLIFVPASVPRKRRMTRLVAVSGWTWFSIVCRPSMERLMSERPQGRERSLFCRSHCH